MLYSAVWSPAAQDAREHIHTASSTRRSEYVRTCVMYVYMYVLTVTSRYCLFIYVLVSPT